MDIVVTQSVDERNTNRKEEKLKWNLVDCSQRAQCLRAIVLGGNEGLVGMMLLLTGVGSFTHDNYPEAVLIRGFATLIAGALSIGTAEFVSCYTQVDIMDFQAKNNMSTGRNDIVKNLGTPNLTQIALAASLAYAVAGTIPLLAASFASDHKIRLSIAATTTCLSMIGLEASLGNAPIARSCARVLFGGCVEVMVLVAKSDALEAYRKTRNKKCYNL